MYNLLDMGSIMIREIMMSLDKRTLSTLQENEVRKAYFVSTEKLNSFLKVKIETKNLNSNKIIAITLIEHPSLFIWSLHQA